MQLDLPQEEGIEQEDMTPDEVAASLSFATTLGEKMMTPMQAEGMEQPQEEGEAAPMQEEPQPTEAPMEEPVAEETEPEAEQPDIEALVDAKVEEKMSALREELTAALSEDDEQS